jgi:hypothetical protein
MRDWRLFESQRLEALGFAADRPDPPLAAPGRTRPVRLLVLGLVPKRHRRASGRRSLNALVRTVAFFVKPASNRPGTAGSPGRTMRKGTYCRQCGKKYPIPFTGLRRIADSAATVESIVLDDLFA